MRELFWAAVAVRDALIADPKIWVGSRRYRAAQAAVDAAYAALHVGEG